MPSLQEEGVQTSLNFKKSLPVPSAVGTLIMLPFPVKASNSTAPPVEHPSSSAEPFEQVPLGQWFYIEWGPLMVGQSNIKDIANGLMTEFTHRGVLGIHSNAVAHPYIAPVDLLYVDKVYACTGSKLECDALLACGPPPIKTPEDFKMEFLDYVRHPPRLPEAITQYPPANFPARKWDMQMIEFTTVWLMNRIEQIHDVPIDLKQLEIFLHIHARTGFKQAFIAPIWPNTSQVNTIIRQIASAERSASLTFGVLSCILVEQSCGPIATTSINFISFTYSCPVSCLASLGKTILVELSAGVSVNMVRTQAHPESLDSSQSSTKCPRPSMKGSSSNPKPPSPKAKCPLSKAKVLSSKGTPASSSAKTASNAPASSSPAVPSKALDPLWAVAKAPMFASTSRQTLVSVNIHSRISTNPPLKVSTSSVQRILPSSSPNLPNPLDITSAKKDRALTSADVLALLDQGQKLSHQLPLNVPEWDQKDDRATCLWDARHPETIPLSFAGGGEDHDEDWENLDPVLNRVLHVDVPMDVLVKGIRRGSSGTLGIVEGLAFFVEKHSLNPVYFGTKLQRLVEALEVRIKLETTNATSDKIMAREVTPPSSLGFGLRDGWSPESPVDHSVPIHRPSLEPPDRPRSQKSQHQMVSFDDSLDDCNEDDDHSDEDGEDGDDTADIQRRRCKFWNDEIDEVVEMFCQFEETKVKPCAQCLGCTVTCLMRIGKWSLNMSEHQQCGNPWNVYLNLLKEKDEFVSKSEACNSYAKLKNDMGGSDTEAWAAEMERLMSELCGRKTAVGKKKGESGGDVVKLMEQTQCRWNADGKTLLNTGIHTFYMMVSDMASLSAAHSWNTSSMNSPQMESWYKSHFDPTQHIGDIYKYILAQQLRSKEVEALEEGESHWQHIMETQDMHHTKAACAQRMCKLLGPYMLVKVKVTKWMEIPKLLRLNRLWLEGLPTVDEFPLLGSWIADKYQTSHWNKMYEAFTRPEDHRIHLEELPESPLDSDESMLPVMIDHRGRVQHTIGSVDRARASNNWSGGATLGGEGINSPVLDEVREENVESTMGKRKYSELGRSWDSTGIGPGHAAEDAGEHDSDVEEDERPVRRRRKLQLPRRSTSTIPDELDKSPTPLSPNSLIRAQANQSPPPFLATTSASSHVGATVPLVNSRVTQLHRMPTYSTNSGASTPLDNFATSTSPPIQALRDSSASSSSTPNSGPDMMITHPNGPLQASSSLPSAQVHLSAADFDALQMSFETTHVHIIPFLS
ncbi:hypothetical protein BS47DRAFT_1365952 [Hydnum rufescens UP504]|uniref:Uncharacterized protein n=1 Tax=Hydnum rufescens UP504 TaxID=1448309 RepID=A0A9P6AP78_9AGAM|nr:hypothetical protein BS47DRAFT_1365952 [Hydnum rufescens UP504]